MAFDNAMAEMLEELKKKLVLDGKMEYFFRGKRISKENFSVLGNLHEQMPVAFIDGGMAEIFSAPDFSLQLVRCASVIYKNKKRAGSAKKEFFALLSLDKNKKICFNFFGKDKEFFEKINKFHDLTAREREDFAAFGNFVMELFEFSEIKNLLRSGFSGLIVRDGSFDKIKEVQKILDFDFYAYNITGLAKTSDLTADTGEGISFVLKNIGPKNEKWCFCLCENIFFVKLHQKSKYVFRIDVFNSKKAEELISKLLAYSADSVFLGYPYGLVEVDRAARISNQEVAFLRKKLKMLLGKDFAALEAVVSSKNAHDVLDKIKF